MVKSALPVTKAAAAITVPIPYRDDDDFAKHSIAQKAKEIRFEA